MSDSQAWILDDDAPPAPRFVLPRLQIIHLMMWMAATAAALVPYRINQEQTGRLSPAAQASADNPANIVMGVGSGVATGAFLFVAAAVIVWRRRGYSGPAEPGHF